jgi:diguanylate cyclase (GGDEF)-like protein
MIFAQIFDMINVGIVVLDKELMVIKWNRWMETHSEIKAEQIIGHSLFEFYPQLKTKWFNRSCKSVLKFGNFSFFSQKLHKYVFPFKSVYTVSTGFSTMQQSVTMGPLRDKDNQIQYLYIMIQDVTEIAAYEQKLLEMNIRDPLTGAFNRRFMFGRLKEEIERYRRYGRPFSVIIQDIDFFKNINDAYGHICGDFVLKKFAKLNLERLRSIDLYTRYGGEEFCCILPETDLDSAYKLAENLRRKIEEHVFIFEGVELRISMSQGLAEVTPDISTAEELLKCADERLYQAKKNGRNNIVAKSFPC